MKIVGIVAVLLISRPVLSARPTCVAIDDGDDKTSVLASCTFMDLTDIPIDLPVHSVVSLDVSDNELKVVHNESLIRYVNVRTLMLSYNIIKHVSEDAFSGLQQLREVDLSYNELEYIDPGTFSNNPRLESVSLAGNPLVYFSPDVPVLISSSLTSLDLSACSLTSVHRITFSKLPKLTNLDLSSNHMQVIHRESLESLDNLKNLELRNNRWECSCDVRDVIEWASSLRTHPFTQRPVKCVERGRYKTLWSQIKGEETCRVAPASRGVMIEEVEDEGNIWFKVSMLRRHSSSNLMLAFLILPCVLSICVLLSLITVRWMDRRRAEDKLPLYKHIQQ